MLLRVWWVSPCSLYVIRSIMHARTLVVMPRLQQWSLDAIRDVQATPWSLHEARKLGVIKLDSATGRTELEVCIPQVRRVYIHQRDVVGLMCCHKIRFATVIGQIL